MTGAGAAMVGHDEAMAQFDAALASGRMHHAWLLAGPRGMGKAVAAHAMARRLLSWRPEGGPDEQAAHLFDAGTHPDFLVLEREEREKGKGRELARNITVDQIRSAQGRLTMSAALGGFRVILIDAVDDLEREGANAMLKTLEEPPARTVLILVAHNPGRLLPTIRSRCRVARFQPLPDDVMTAWLRREAPHMGDADRAALVMAARGVPGVAHAMLGERVGALDAGLRAIMRSGDPDNQLREAMARAHGTAAGRAAYEGMLATAPALLARMARTAEPGARGAFIAAWDSLDSMIRDAQRGSYDPAMTTMAVGTLFAGLSPHATGIA